MHGAGAKRRDLVDDGAVTPTDLRLCLNFTTDVLRSIEGREWSRAVHGIDMTVSELVAHVAITGMWYSVDLTAAGQDLTTVQPAVSADAENDEMITTLAVLIELLARAIEASPADARGFHPFGMADRSGFVAMACDELLIHGYDIAVTFGVDYEPPAELVELVLQRLFPWAQAGDTEETGPWPTLLWANGRADLPEHTRPRRWTWHCAPLDEWDGTNLSAG